MALTYPVPTALRVATQFYRTCSTFEKGCPSTSFCKSTPARSPPSPRETVVSEAGALERDLLQGLLWAYGPSGQEDAVRDVYLRELAPLVDESWVDPPQAMWSS